MEVLNKLKKNKENHLIFWRWFHKMNNIMIDNIKIIKNIKFSSENIYPQNQSFQWFNLKFYPVVKYDEVRCYRAQIDNLFLTIWQDTLIIQNSLCKYHFGGSNHYNFSYYQLNKTVTNLESILGISLRDAKVGKFEYGLVQKVQSPQEIFDNLGSYKTKQPQDMLYYGKKYGIFYQNSTHDLRLYDEKFAAQKRDVYLDFEMIRVEKRANLSYINSLALFKNKKIETLGDLCKRETLKLLGEDIIISLIKINLRNLPNSLADLSTQQKRIFGYMENPIIREAMKRHHPDTFKNDSTIFNNIQKDYRESLYNRFIQELIDRVSECVND